MTLLRRAVRYSVRCFAAPSPPRAPEADLSMAEFLRRSAALPAPRVLELGTLRPIAGRSTIHRDWVPNAGEYLGADLEAGPDVDIVADLHALTEVVGVEAFDVLISCSTFEHLKYPHPAAHQIMKSLKVGGLLFIQTHQTFPLHAHPFDYILFSREALAGLFGTRMGFQVLATNYMFPAATWSREVGAISAAPAHLNVKLLGQKTGPTPDTYVFELDYAPAP